jgi:peroxiredoxin
MTLSQEQRPPLQPGERAPDFTLLAADREGSVSLADYRGRSPVLLSLLRGLY